MPITKRQKVANAGKDVEKRESFTRLLMEIPNYSSYCGGTLKTLGIDLYDPVIPLLGAYPRKIKFHVTCTPMFVDVCSQ